MSLLLFFLIAFKINLNLVNTTEDFKNKQLDKIKLEVISDYSNEEVNGLFKCLDFIKKLNLINKPITAITSEVILNIHLFLLNNIVENTGKYRNVNIYFWGSPHKFPDFNEIPKLMDEYIKWLHEPKKDKIKFALDAHLKFVNIHPFTDCNGRLARLIMNIILIQNGYKPIIINTSIRERDSYKNCIKNAQIHNNLIDYYKFFIKKSYQNK